MLSDRRHKKEKIQHMFAGISKRYDFLNSVLSLNRDKYWRRVAVSKLGVDGGSCFLDFCAGTGDVSVEILEQKKASSGRVVAGDFCVEMLQVGVEKCIKLGIDTIDFVNADAENIPFASDYFDGAIVAFGIRNVSDRNKALSELARTIKTGKKLVILDFSIPVNRIFKSAYHFYFKKILPFIGSIVSKDNSAYAYLPESVLAFPEREEFAEMMKDAGMKRVDFFDLTFGIVTVYVGTR